MITSTTIDARIAPTTDTTKKSTSEIVFARPNATDIDLARIARTTEIDSERLKAAAAFWPTGVSSRRDMRNVPAWIEVPRRLPERAEDVAPHADRGGHEHEQAGKRSSVPVMEPSVRPATRSLPDEIRSAMKPARTPDEVRSARARRSAHRRGAGRADIGYWEVRSAYARGGSGR